MARHYGTKSWAKWANQNLDFVLILLREPDKQWNKELTYSQAAIKSLSIIKKELEEVISP